MQITTKQMNNTSTGYHSLCVDESKEALQNRNETHKFIDMTGQMEKIIAETYWPELRRSMLQK